MEVGGNMVTKVLLDLVWYVIWSVDKQDYISREEFESKFQSQQREIESLQKQLNYWQNTTINILTKYPINGEGESIANSCTVEVEDELSLNDLSQQMEEIFNQTQGKGHIIISLHHILTRMIYDQEFEICSMC